MCRHLAFLGPSSPLADIVITPPQGLYEQSWAPRRQRHGTVNADGFGLGWYPQADPGPGPDPDAGPGAVPARYRRAVPVWADPNLPDLTRTLHSGAVLAAVRDATPGTAQDETAAAPYAADGWLFSHNGALDNWQRLPDELPSAIGAAELLELESRCDSALLWALLLRALRAGTPPVEALTELVRRTSAVRPGARLNFLLTDGRTIIATRWGDTLWYRQTGESVVVASEPDARSGWHEVPDRTLLSASAITVETVPLAAEPPPLSALREEATA